MAFAGGTGTVDDPYLVSTPDQLNDVRNYLTSSFKQINDIDLCLWGDWCPIGRNSVDEATYNWRLNVPFLGNYDGGDYKIMNMSINLVYASSSTFNNSELGMFWKIGDDSIENPPSVPDIKNIHLENVNITGYQSIGALANFSIGKLTNCSADGIISGEDMGGLVWQQYDMTTLPSKHLSDVIDCYSDVTINGLGPGNLGGLIGECGSWVVTNCYATGDVIQPITPYVIYTGGLFAETYSYNGTDNITVSHCYATGNVQGPDVTGGFVARSENTNFVNCYCMGDVTTGDSGTAGGFCSFALYTSFTNCYSKGKPLRGTYIHYGFCANPDSNTTFTSCYYDQETSGSSDTGHGEPRTTVQMKTQSTFINWDFANIWHLVPIYNEGYPQFKAVGSAPVLFNVFIKKSGAWLRATMVFVKKSGAWCSLGRS